MFAKLKRTFAGILLTLLIFSNTFQAIAATITVDSLNDNGAGGNCELRDAINSANNNAAFDNCTAGDPFPVIDNIDFSSGPGTITLNGTALPTITEAVNIDGDIDDDDNFDITLDATNTSRILDVAAPQVTAQGLRFLNGASAGTGGAIHVQTTADLTLLNSIVNDSTAARGGAIGVESDSGQVTLDGVGFDNNSADEGGTIYVDQETVNVDPEVIDLSIDHTTITNSTASSGNGGSIYIGDNNEAQIAHTSITTSNASLSGGAIYHAGESVNPPTDTADLVLDEINIFDAHALGASGQGGGIYLGPGIDTTSSGFNDIEQSSAVFGGGVYVGGSSGVFTLSVGDIINSSTADYGGGIFVDTAGMLQIGGLVGLEPQIINNDANIAGGGVYINDYANTTLINHAIFDSNSSLIDGGAIALSPGTTFYLNDSVLNNNEASNVAGKGGGIFAYDNYSPGEEKNINLTNVELSQNRAYDGGGIYGGNRSNITLNNVFSVVGNIGDGQGGFLEMGTAGADGTLNMTNSNISNSIAGYCGAMVVGSPFNPLSPPIQISNTIFDNNQSNIGFGGAICLNVGSMLLDNVDFTNNYSIDNGGVLFLNDNGNDSSTEIINGSDFDQNYASASGGSIYVSENVYTNTVTIDGSTFTGTNATNSYGGFIYNQDGHVNISNTSFSAANNLMAALGGAIGNTGIMTLDAVQILSTGALVNGGAIFNYGNLTIDNSTLEDNQSAFSTGGAIYNQGDLQINQSFIGSNHGTDAGAIDHAGGNLSITNSTIANNLADTNGGAIHFGNSILTANITSSTIANNNANAGDGGGIWNEFAAPVNINNTIFAYNTAFGFGPDCYSSGQLSSGDYNLFSNNSDCGGIFQPNDLLNLDPLLGVLGLNGGTTQNYPLLVGSPAMNTGNTALTIDQRGITRPQNGADDIGSFEYDIDITPPVLAQVTPVPTPDTDTTPNYTFSSTEAGNISYGGDCSSATIAAVVGNNTVTFNALATGLHVNCTITVTDIASNVSSVLAVSAFEIINPPTPPASGGGGGGSASFGHGPSSGGQPSVPTESTQPSEPTTPVQPTLPSEPSTPATPTEPAQPSSPSQPTNQTTTVTPASPVTAETTESPSTTESSTAASNSESTAPTSSTGSSTGSVFVPADFVRFSPSVNSSTCNTASFASEYHLTSSLSGDSDGDGLSDAIECQLNTSPINPDSDNDGKTDGFETLNLNTNPNQADDFTPGHVDRDFVIVTLPENSLITADESPLFLGMSKPAKNVNVYIFDQSVLDRSNQTEEEFNNYLIRILQKFVSNTLDPNNPEESKFIGKIRNIGNASTDNNGLFALDSDLSLRDNQYLVMGNVGQVYSEPVEFTIDSSLQFISPIAENLGDQTLTAENLTGQKTVQLDASQTKPILTGKITVPSKIVALWQSNISSSALLADALDQDFRLSPPADLEPGEHTVILTAYRSSDNAQSKSQKIRFYIPGPTVEAISSGPWAYLLVGLLSVLLIILIFRRQQKNTASPETANSPTPPASV